MNRFLTTMIAFSLLVFAASCGGGGGGGGEAAVCEDFSAAVSVQIQTARDTSDGAVSLPIHGAYVTYVKSAVGNDSAGFYVQGLQTGPALFVDTDSAGFGTVPAVGDQVSFTVTQMGTTDARRDATGITGYSLLCQEDSVGSLSQDLSAATDLVSGLAGYESELIDLAGTVVADFGAAGPGFVSAQVETAGVTAETNLKLRVPSTLQSSLGLENGCAFTLDDTPLGRLNSEAQPSAWSASDIQVSNCPPPPAPQVVSALALSTDLVRVTFDRDIQGSSIISAATQFIFNGGLTAVSAVADSTGVTVTTGSQVSGTSYTVTVANTVTDTLGTGVDAAANTAGFTGFQGVQALVINEIRYDSIGMDGSEEFVEILGTEGISLAGYYLVGVNGADGSDYSSVALSGTIPSGGYYVVASSTAITAADAVNAGVDFQNGPDNLQIVFDYNGSKEQVVDALGYGDFTGGVFAGEGTPALDVAAGHSLSRCPDGTDTDDNSTDFLDTVAVSPGAGNTCTGQLCSSAEITLFGNALASPDPNALTTLWNSDQMSQQCDDATISYLTCVDTNCAASSDVPACIVTNCSTEFYNVYGYSP